MAKKDIADSKHAFACGTCGLSRKYLAALIVHVRDIHNRKLSRPEYTPITLRQAYNLKEEKGYFDRMSESNMVPFDADNEIGNLDFGQFGNQPLWSKEDLNGKVIVVVGVSTEKFEGEFDTPARSLLHYMPDEERDYNEPWGLLLSENSPAITRALGQLEKNGGKPFYARLLKKQGRKYPYWNIEAVRAVYNDSGQIAGFRVTDGTIIDNTEAPLAMPERKERKK